jgi:hypothetical protein
LIRKGLRRFAASSKKVSAGVVVYPILPRPQSQSCPLATGSGPIRQHGPVHDGGQQHGARTLTRGAPVAANMAAGHQGQWHRRRSVFAGGGRVRPLIRRTPAAIPPDSSSSRPDNRSIDTRSGLRTTADPLGYGSLCVHDACRARSTCLLPSLSPSRFDIHRSPSGTVPMGLVV